jgi:lipoyl(octanoyl) transferase
VETIRYQHLGTMEYGAAWALQEQYMERNLKAKAARYNASATAPEADQPAETEHHLFFCRHPHVYTLGKSGHMENLLLGNARLKELGVSFYRTNRGGDITYHGPGQIVGYPVLDLERFFTDLGRYMRSLEEVVIRVLAAYGIEGDRLPGATGVWLEPATPRARKICAMGVKCSRWVTMHGFALNVNTDLSYFNHIVPCGISDKSVTSMQQELGRAVDEQETEKLLREAFAEVFGAEIKEEIFMPDKREMLFL